MLAPALIFWSRYWWALPAERLDSRAHGSRQTDRVHERTRRRPRAGDVHLVFHVADVLHRHEAAEAGNQLALNVRVNDGERRETDAAERRRAPLVAPHQRPVAQLVRAVRRADRL